MAPPKAGKDSESVEAAGGDQPAREGQAGLVTKGVRERRDGRGDDEDETPPWILEVVGEVGVYLAFLSLLLTIVGLISIYIRFQPVGNIAITFGLVGITVSMIIGMVYQAYVGDYTLDDTVAGLRRPTGRTGAESRSEDDDDGGNGERNGE